MSKNGSILLPVLGRVEEELDAVTTEEIGVGVIDGIWEVVGGKGELGVGDTKLIAKVEVEDWFVSP